MRVVHLVEILAGGPATFLNQLLPLQARSYQSVTLVCPEDQIHLLDCPEVKIIPAPRQSRSPAGIWKWRDFWAKTVRGTDADIVHLHSTFAGLIGRVNVRPSGAKVVYCAHGWSHSRVKSLAKKQIYASVERFLAHDTAAIINISGAEHLLAQEYRIQTGKDFVVRNGIADASWTPLPITAGARKLLFVGRFDRQKGVDLLLDAFKSIESEGFELTLIGEPVVGTESPVIPKSVTYLGWQSAAGVQDAIQKSDILVVPSRWEGFGLVAVEAMRAGRPVVAARVGGLAEVVVDGVTGALFEPGNLGSLIRAIRETSQKDIQQLGVNGRARFEREFTSDRLFAETHKVYKTVLNV